VPQSKDFTGNRAITKVAPTKGRLALKLQMR
jgi:hypothetical protein